VGYASSKLGKEVMVACMIQKTTSKNNSPFKADMGILQHYLELGLSVSAATAAVVH